MANNKYRVVTTKSHEPASVEEVINRYCNEENLKLVSIHPGTWFPATSQLGNLLIVFKTRKVKKVKKVKRDTNYGSSVGLWQIKMPPYQRDREKFPKEAYVDDVYQAFRPPAEDFRDLPAEEYLKTQLGSEDDDRDDPSYDDDGEVLE